MSSCFTFAIIALVKDMDGFHLSSPKISSYLFDCQQCLAQLVISTYLELFFFLAFRIVYLPIVFPTSLVASPYFLCSFWLVKIWFPRIQPLIPFSSLSIGSILGSHQVLSILMALIHFICPLPNLMLQSWPLFWTSNSFYLSLGYLMPI